MRSSLIYGADARPRKPVMTAIADAIQRGEPSQNPEACASVCAASPRYALRLAVIPGHERASWRHTKRHEITFYLIPATFPHSAEYADWLMSNNSTPRSVRDISCLVCAISPQFVKGRTSNVRSFREISCRTKAAFVSDYATKPEGLLLRDVMGRAEGSRPYDDALKQIAARRCRIVSVRGRA